MTDKPTPDGWIELGFSDGTDHTIVFADVDWVAERPHGLVVKYPGRRVTYPWAGVHYYANHFNSAAYCAAYDAWREDTQPTCARCGDPLEQTDSGNWRHEGRGPFDHQARLDPVHGVWPADWHRRRDENGVLT